MEATGKNKKYRPYSEVLPELEGLSKVEQYNELLLTKEWQQLRNTILERDRFTCTKCHEKAGPKYKEIPFESWLKKYQIVQEENKKRRKWRKENPEEFTRLLAGGGDFESKMDLLEPSRIEFEYDVILQVHHKLYFWEKLPWDYNHSVFVTLCQNCHKEVHELETIYMYLNEEMKFRRHIPPCDRCDGTGYFERFKHINHGICFSCGGLGVLHTDFPVWEKIE